MSTHLEERGYRPVATLGAGSSGRVYEVERGGATYAAKIVADVELTADGVPLEADILMHLRDVPGVARLRDVVRLPCGSHAMVMDTPTGPFSTLFRCPWPVDARLVLTRLVRILRDVDARNVCHMDLHAQNILVSPGSDVTLVDFGRAQYKDRPFPLVDLYAEMDDSPPELRERGVFDYDRMTTWSVGLLALAIGSRDSTVLDDLLAPYELRITLDEMFDHPYFADEEMDVC